MFNRPVTLIVAAAVLAAEGLTAIALGGYAGVQTVAGGATAVGDSIVISALGLVVGAALLWVAWGVSSAARWSRAPGVVTQIFSVPVGVSLTQSGQYVPGALLLALAAAGVVALLAPPTTRAMIKD
ncbi:hypothetical protein ABGB17_17940 [Sphaerisporangium sp. B11E5]|uniref:hypothetical protein n=1 Tax=Sphaerisporangium sp. B11E5 TaxID=3153563 RepID=UPI00325CB250